MKRTLTMLQLKALVGSQGCAVFRKRESSKETSTVRVCRDAPELASHSLTVSWSDADASSLPSGEKATALTT
jgi:hypothetical protein